MARSECPDLDDPVCMTEYLLSSVLRCVSFPSELSYETGLCVTYIARDASITHSVIRIPIVIKIAICSDIQYTYVARALN